MIDLNDRRLARIVKRCQDIPGYELFQYLDDDGKRQSIDSSDVNSYLREISGQDFTAKDFRTWAGTVLAALALQEFAAFLKAHIRRHRNAMTSHAVLGSHLQRIFTLGNYATGNITIGHNAYRLQRILVLRTGQTAEELVS